jgi:hypothetical protein
MEHRERKRGSEGERNTQMRARYTRFLGCLYLEVARLKVGEDLLWKMIGIGLPEVFPCLLRRRLCCRRPIVRQRDRVITRERGRGSGSGSERDSERERERERERECVCV